MANTINEKECENGCNRQTFGDETVVKFYPKQEGLHDAIIAIGRGSAKTHPIFAETNLGVFSFERPFQFGMVSVDALFDEADPVVTDSSEEQLRREIKHLEKRLKYEKHPLQQKKLRAELDGLKKLLKKTKRK